MDVINSIKKLFGVASKEQTGYSDPTLGTFSYQQGIGWIGSLVIGRVSVKLVIGSDGELPSDRVLRSMKNTVANLQTIQATIIEFATVQLRTAAWCSEPNLPDPSAWTLSSIQILWGNDPDFVFVYFKSELDERDWFVSIRNEVPVELSYDH